MCDRFQEPDFKKPFSTCDCCNGEIWVAEGETDCLCDNKHVCGSCAICCCYCGKIIGCEDCIKKSDAVFKYKDCFCDSECVYEYDRMGT